MSRNTFTGPDAAGGIVRIDWRIAIACTALLVLLFSFQTLPVTDYSQIPRFPRTLFPTALAWGLWLPLIPLVFGIARRANVRRLGNLRGILLLLTGSVVVCLVHIVALTLARWGLGLTGPRNLLVLLPGMVKLTFATDFLRYWLIAAAYYAIAYHREVRERAINEANLAADLAEARLEALEARMHPHFLFNTLNAITALIRKDPPQAAAMVENLSDLLRAALNSEPGKMVSLASELEFLDRYVAIQKARFPDRLEVRVTASTEALHADVPCLILQPLVENAIRHGIAPREAPGTVTIEATLKGAALLLTVRDDGVGFGVSRDSVAEGSGGFGLNGTRARLAHLYGKSFVFEIADAEPSGTIVRIELPLQSSHIIAGRPAA